MSMHQRSTTSDAGLYRDIQDSSSRSPQAIRPAAAVPPVGNLTDDTHDDSSLSFHPVVLPPRKRRRYIAEIALRSEDDLGHSSRTGEFVTHEPESPEDQRSGRESSFEKLPSVNEVTSRPGRSRSPAPSIESVTPGEWQRKPLIPLLGSPPVTPESHHVIKSESALPRITSEAEAQRLISELFSYDQDVWDTSRRRDLASPPVMAVAADQPENHLSGSVSTDLPAQAERQFLEQGGATTERLREAAKQEEGPTLQPEPVLVNSRAITQLIEGYEEAGEVPRRRGSVWAGESDEERLTVKKETPKWGRSEPGEVGLSKGFEKFPIHVSAYRWSTVGQCLLQALADVSMSPEFREVVAAAEEEALGVEPPVGYGVDDLVDYKRRQARSSLFRILQVFDNVMIHNFHNIRVSSSAVPLRKMTYRACTKCYKELDCNLTAYTYTGWHFQKADRRSPSMLIHSPSLLIVGLSQDAIRRAGKEVFVDARTHIREKTYRSPGIPLTIRTEATRRRNHMGLQILRRRDAEALIGDLDAEVEWSGDEELQQPFVAASQRQTETRSQEIRSAEAVEQTTPVVSVSQPAHQRRRTPEINATQPTRSPGDETRGLPAHPITARGGRRRARPRRIPTTMPRTDQP